jgi:hypothetical protein
MKTILTETLAGHSSVSTVLLDVTPRSLVGKNQRVGEICLLHSESRRGSRAEKRGYRYWESRKGNLCLLPASRWFLLAFLFGPEDGGHILLRNIGWFTPLFLTLIYICLFICGLFNDAFNNSE